MKLTEKQRTDNAWLRMEVYTKLQEFNKEDDRALLELISILGYENLVEMQDNFTDKDANICRALSGPYGLTIYKMLLIRKHEDEPPP